MNINNIDMKSESNQVFQNWDDKELNLSMEILRGIYAYGFEKPSPIQTQAIMPILGKRDIIAQAQSGTGKSGAFIISSLELVDSNIDVPQVIILSPTRELARQSFAVCQSLGSMSKVQCLLLVGGSRTDIDIQKLSTVKPHIISGTPGRIFDMIGRGHLKTEKLKFIAFVHFIE